MSHLSTLLQKLFKKRDLKADAATLGVSEDFLKAIVKGTPSEEAVLPPTAIKIAELTGGNAHAILKAQVDDQLEVHGLAPPKVPAAEVKLDPPGKKTAGSPSTSPSHRAPVSPTAVQRFDINK